ASVLRSAACGRAPVADGSVARSCGDLLLLDDVANCSPQRIECGGERVPFLRALAEEGLDGRQALDRFVQPRVSAALVGADGDEVARVVVGGKQLAEAAGRGQLLRGDDR